MTSEFFYTFTLLRPDRQEDIKWDESVNEFARNNVVNGAVEQGGFVLFTNKNCYIVKESALKRATLTSPPSNL
ncbi:MAG: hypothetical protein COS89_00900 [Deltaproteobacteria bacterium CG07_land_8_20_14_0_80_38_7]|nr:MAG: hypothetical protein COS89_00900 [Deltaproteobacteria bacterium CG07_land_8_20_14_0_80_38_7]